MNIIKKLLAMLLIICTLLGVAACGKEISNDETQGQSITEISRVAESLTGEVLSTAVAGDDIGGGTPGLLKYRSIFYSVSYPFSLIVAEPAYLRWKYSFSRKQKCEDSERMRMSWFIDDFGITREEFDKANYAWAVIIRDRFKDTPMLEPKDYSNQETSEVYNADIIYSFDDAKIKNYYLCGGYPYCTSTDYDEALASGEYKTRTTKWVDVDEFKKEIISKYGTTEYEPRPLEKKEFRASYYDVTEPFQALVSDEKYEAWRKEIYANGHDGLEEMAMVSFVKHFNISREDFDRANKDWAEIMQGSSGEPSTYNPYDYPAQGYYELYNPDIIYTFDNDKIDEYYREHDYAYNTKEECEKAIAAGKYKSKADGYIVATVDDFTVSKEPIKLPE